MTVWSSSEIKELQREAEQIIVDIFDAMVVKLRGTRHASRQHAGSMVNRKALTSAMIDSRGFLAARRRAETEVILPAGPKIAFTGGSDVTDHRLIWDTLDKVHVKHPGMVLTHGGSPKGTKLIASRWADSRQVAQIAFKPDWTKHTKAAPLSAMIR